uniref:PTM/DIR17-like Tudor domain-containing protein n=1 Tax=Arundo donax TaxID=35708 RepID=A0A0A9F502_ARUDO
MVSPKTSAKGPGRSKRQGAENSTSKRKQEQETEEPPRSRKNKGLDGSLVGARIKVWWPDDKMFYNGVVDSFDSVSKRHKVAYDDGDVEVLLLREEKWEFISEKKRNCRGI